MQKLLVAVLALLVSHAAGGLAGGLAGSLALAAAAVPDAGAEITGLKGLNPLHNKYSILSAKSTYLHLYRLKHCGPDVKGEIFRAPHQPHPKSGEERPDYRLAALTRMVEPPR